MKIIVKTLFAAAILASLNVSAQEAISSYTPGNVVGYATNGAGFQFSPTTAIAVTALGFGYSNSLAYSPYQMTLFNAAGTQLATAQVTTASTFYNQTYYQAISPVTLAAGSIYYLEGVEANGDNLWVGNVAGVADLGGSFTADPNITYLNGANNFVSGIPATLDGPGIFFLDENFQFSPVPEPATLSLAASGLAGLILWQRRKR